MKPPKKTGHAIPVLTRNYQARYGPKVANALFQLDALIDAFMAANPTDLEITAFGERQQQDAACLIDEGSAGNLHEVSLTPSPVPAPRGDRP